MSATYHSGRSHCPMWSKSSWKRLRRSGQLLLWCSSITPFWTSSSISDYSGCECVMISLDQYFLPPHVFQGLKLLIRVYGQAYDLSTIWVNRLSEFRLYSVNRMDNATLIPILKAWVEQVTILWSKFKVLLGSVMGFIRIMKMTNWVHLCLVSRTHAW